MNSERIKEIQQSMTAYPESVSVMLALKQVWNECEQEDKWISVQDDLPPVNEIVHVWKNGLKKAKLVLVGDTKLWHYEHGMTLTYEAPFYWQPLLTEPKKLNIGKTAIAIK